MHAHDIFIHTLYLMPNLFYFLTNQFFCFDQRNSGQSPLDAVRDFVKQGKIGGSNFVVLGLVLFQPLDLFLLV
jgi:hypothetical protein